MTSSEREVQRVRVRRRALGNLVLVLMAQAARSAGRLAVEGAREAVRLRFRGVRTLVRRGGLFAFEHRNFSVLVVCPPGWPFARQAALVPFVAEPGDWAHSNSDGRGICIDLAGVLPERLAEIIYDVLRLKRRRLDHVVDGAAAAFMRSRVEELPSDPEPLFPAASESDEPEDGAARTAGCAVADPELPALVGDLAVQGLPDEDFVVGTVGVAMPVVDQPTFLRLAPLAGSPVDRARIRYLARARAELRAATAGWMAGPGLIVTPDADRERLRDELSQVARGLAVLDDAAIAQSYLEMCSA
jgi:hypothetical protein